MAPPKNRRLGFSRRAQFGLFLGYVIAVGGALVAVLLLAIAIVDPRGFAALRGAALDATAPVAGAGRSVVGFFSGIGERHLQLLQRRIARMRELQAASSPRPGAS